MKKVLIFLMFAMTMIIAASNAVTKRIGCPDVDVGYVMNIDNDINAEAILSENQVLTIYTTGNRQEGATEVTIRSGPTKSEDIFIYSSNWRLSNDEAMIFRLCMDNCYCYCTTDQSSKTKDKPAIVFRV